MWGGCTFQRRRKGAPLSGFGWMYISAQKETCTTKCFWVDVRFTEEGWTHQKQLLKDVHFTIQGRAHLSKAEIGCPFHYMKNSTSKLWLKWVSISPKKDMYIQKMRELGVKFTVQGNVHPKKRELDVEFTVRGNVHPTHLNPPEPTLNPPEPTLNPPEPTRNLPEATRLPRVTVSERSSRVNLALDRQSQPLRLRSTHPARWSGR